MAAASVLGTDAVTCLGGKELAKAMPRLPLQRHGTMHSKFQAPGQELLSVPEKSGTRMALVKRKALGMDGLTAAGLAAVLDLLMGFW